MPLRELLPDDAPALSALFRRCYGETYGTPYFYDVDALRDRIERRLLRSVVVAEDDRLLGHMGITIRHANSAGCETGNTVVDPEARGRGLLKSLAMGLTDLVVREGFCGYVHYPTTAHDIMQRASVSRGGRETGIMLAYVPAETDYEDFDQDGGRLAVTIVYQPLTPAPARRVVLPERYRKTIVDLYAGVYLEREVVVASEVAPVSNQDPVVDFNRQRKSLHVFLGDSGDDIAALLATEIEKYSPMVTYVDLLLDDPKVDSHVESLRALGFFFCGLMPEFARTDVLRMQKLHDPAPENFEPKLANEGAKALLELIRADAP